MGGGVGTSSGGSGDLAGSSGRLATEFPVTSGGYFGVPGSGGSGRVRTIESPAAVTTAGRFFSLAGRGGAMIIHNNGVLTVLSFGGRLRVEVCPRSSSDGSLVAWIYSWNLPGKHPAFQEILFTRRNP